MRLPWQRRAERRSAPLYSISDPLLIELFGAGTQNFSGVTVTEHSALGLSAIYRSISLIAGTIATLPLKTYITNGDLRDKAGSFLDNPWPGYGVPFQWKELTLIYLLLHNEVFLQHMYNGAGAITGLNPVHPLCVSVKRDESRLGGKLFTVTLENGQRKEFDASSMTHVCRFSLDGLRGTSPITLARNSIGTGIAGDRAAARMFSSGALISGLVTPEGDIDPDEALTIKRELDQKMTGSENSGSVAVINRRLKFTPWSLSAEDAQFLQSRQFQIEEVCRWWGVPPHLLMQSEKSTSWGSGIEEQDRGLARYVLSNWTTLLQECLSALIPAPKFVEFDYSGLLQPSPEQEIELLLKQVDGGLLTLNEARRLRNYPPVDGGDVPRQGFAQPDQTSVDSPQETKDVSASS